MPGNFVRKWDDSFIQSAIESLTTSHTINQALDKLRGQGYDVTSSAMRSAFRRNDLPSPSNYLGVDTEEEMEIDSEFEEQIETILNLVSNKENSDLDYISLCNKLGVVPKVLDEILADAEELGYDIKISRVGKAKLSEDKSSVNNKKAIILREYSMLVDSGKSYVTHTDIYEHLGYTKKTIEYYFGSLRRLNEEARVKYPFCFFDVAIEVAMKKSKRLKTALKNYDKFVLTTAVTGCKADYGFVDTLIKYCRETGSHVLVLVASDPAHNQWAPYASYGTVDRVFFDNPEYFTLVFDEKKIHKELSLSTIKLSAKQLNPLTGLKRLANKKGSFIFASPKQRLYAVSTVRGKYPKYVMTTGAATVPDYTTTNYMSNRLAYLAKQDHVVGGLVVELDGPHYHFRQIQYKKEGEIIDLGKRYEYSEEKKETKPTRVRPKAFVLGDWHAGDTSETAKKAWGEVCNELKPEKLIIHDLFNGLSINHHDRKNHIVRARRAMSGVSNLRSEIQKVVDDLNYLTKLADEVVVVKSNHDDFLARYLETWSFTEDHENVRYALDLAAAHMDGFDPLVFAVESVGLDNPDKVRWLEEDEDLTIEGVQLGQHGHRGTNGSKGSLRIMDEVFVDSITGHTHSPEIYRGAFRVGTSTDLTLEYTKGSGSWAHTSCLLYPGGSRQLINSINGDWRVK